MQEYLPYTIFCVSRRKKKTHKSAYFGENKHGKENPENNEIGYLEWIGGEPGGSDRKGSDTSLSIPFGNGLHDYIESAVEVEEWVKLFQVTLKHNTLMIYSRGKT